MGGDRGTALFCGRSVSDLREEVLADITTRAARLDPDSPENIPESMFLVAVLGNYEFSLPSLQFDRVFSRDVEVDGERSLEIHVPMVGTPRNLHLSPAGPERDDALVEVLAYEFVDGDLCLTLPLRNDRPDDVAIVTDEVLVIAERRYRGVSAQLRSLRSEASKTALEQYRRATDSRHRSGLS